MPELSIGTFGPRSLPQKGKAKYRVEVTGDITKSKLTGDTIKKENGNTVLYGTIFGPGGSDRFQYTGNIVSMKYNDDELKHKGTVRRESKSDPSGSPPKDPVVDGAKKQDSSSTQEPAGSMRTGGDVPTPMPTIGGIGTTVAKPHVEPDRFTTMGGSTEPTNATATFSMGFKEVALLAGAGIVLFWFSG